MMQLRQMFEQFVRPVGAESPRGRETMSKYCSQSNLNPILKDLDDDPTLSPMGVAA